MKKIILILSIICFIYLVSYKDYEIPSESIRYRVISSSNSSEDIVMKYVLVDNLNDLLSTFDYSSIDSTRDSINNNIELISSNIDSVFKEYNYDKKYTINYGLNEFPMKEYEGITYDEGLYESLVITIGDGLGDNFWCVLYPSLCFIEDKDIVYKSKIVEIINKLFK